MNTHGTSNIYVHTFSCYLKDYPGVAITHATKYSLMVECSCGFKPDLPWNHMTHATLKAFDNAKNYETSRIFIHYLTKHLGESYQVPFTVAFDTESLEGCLNECHAAIQG